LLELFDQILTHCCCCCCVCLTRLVKHTQTAPITEQRRGPLFKSPFPVASWKRYSSSFIKYKRYCTVHGNITRPQYSLRFFIGNGMAYHVVSRSSAIFLLIGWRNGAWIRDGDDRPQCECQSIGRSHISFFFLAYYRLRKWNFWVPFRARRRSSERERNTMAFFFSYVPYNTRFSIFPWRLAKAWSLVNFFRLENWHRRGVGSLHCLVCIFSSSSSSFDNKNLQLWAEEEVKKPQRISLLLLL